MYYYKWVSYPSFFNLRQTFPFKRLQNSKMFTTLKHLTKINTAVMSGKNPALGAELPKLTLQFSV